MGPENMPETCFERNEEKNLARIPEYIKWRPMDLVTVWWDGNLVWRIKERPELEDQNTDGSLGLGGGCVVGRVRDCEAGW
jgi:hypothetical protein